MTRKKNRISKFKKKKRKRREQAHPSAHGPCTMTVKKERRGKKETPQVEVRKGAVS